MPILLRKQRPDDLPAIAHINQRAFAEHGATAAFDKMRETREDILSLIADDDGTPVGHVLFSPVSIDKTDARLTAMGLGQLAVIPEQQCKGIGSQLTLDGIERLRRQGCPLVIVIGHAGYYPRFGFVPAKRYGLRCQWPGVPDETFMALPLHDNPAQDFTGVASFDGL